MTTCPLADSSLGDDIHGGWIDDATDLALPDGVAEVCSFVDRDADHDSFRIAAPSDLVNVEATADIPLIIELYDGSGVLIERSNADGSRPTGGTVLLEDVPLEPAQPFIVLVHSTKGGRGSYQLTLTVKVQTPSTVFADFDDDGAVAFSDFLILSHNFGKTEDAIFADGDIDGDENVDFADFLILSQQFGRTP